MIGWVLTLFRPALWLVSKVTGSGKLRSIVSDIADAQVRLESAKTEVEKAEIQKEVAQLEALRDLQMASAQRMSSPMMVGQYLIVVPYGIHWAAVWVVSSILAPWFGWDLVVLAAPPDMNETAKWLIPTIITGTLIDRWAGGPGGGRNR